MSQGWEGRLAPALLLNGQMVNGQCPMEQSFIPISSFIEKRAGQAALPNPETFQLESWTLDLGHWTSYRFSIYRFNLIR